MLSRGAGELREFLREKARGIGDSRVGESWWSQEKIAEQLRVSVRTIGRRVAELVAACEIESERRGSTSNVYRLRHLPMQQMGFEFSDVRSDQTNCPNATIILNLPKGKTPSKPPAIEPAAFEETQTQAIEAHVRVSGLEPTAGLLRKLARKARFYGVNGFRIAATIERAWRKVEGTSNIPQGVGWVLAVVENELASASGRHGMVTEEISGQGKAPWYETPCSPLAEESRVSVSGEVAAVLFPPKKPPDCSRIGRMVSVADVLNVMGGFS